MLDLHTPVRTAAGVEFAADTDDPGAYYVLPPSPTVAVEAGAPALQLLRLIEDGELRGGHLRLKLVLEHAPARLEEARVALAEQLRLDHLELRPLPVLSASAELLFVGRETQDEGGLGPLIQRPYGRTAAGFNAPHAAGFSVSLTPEGVRLMEAALTSGGAPVGVVYRLRVEGLWPAMRMLARVDWTQVYEHFSLHIKEGQLLLTEDILRITERLIESRAVSIQVVEGLVPDETGAAGGAEPALAWLQRELIERFCELVMPLNRTPAHADLGTFGEIFGAGSSFAVKRLTQIEQAAAEFDLQRGSVVTRTLTAQAHLADLLAGAPAEAHIADAALDHPFFARFTLRATTARPLAELFVQELLLRFSYGTTDASLRLAPEAPEAVVETWADASPDRTWRILPEVTFADDAPLDPGIRIQLAELSGQTRELNLDLERMLGLARYEIRASADPRVLLTRATLTQRRAEALLAERELALSPASPTALAWLRDLRPGDRVLADVEHLLSDGRQVRIPSFPVDTRIVRLPPAFPGTLTVQLIADEDWTGLERVIVTVQKQADLPAGTRVFERPGQTAAVSLDMPDPLDRRFRYRVSRTFADGRVEEDDWVETDVPVVPVGRVASNRLVVDVTPFGPELPDAGIVLIEVELAYLDPEHQVRDLRTHVIRARADRFRWEVAIADPGRRAYEYRTTVHRTSGAREVGPWTATDTRLLVIPIVKPGSS